MVTFKLVEENEQYLIYWYFPNGQEDSDYGIILLDKLSGTIEIQKMAANDFSHIVTISEQNEMRDSVNEMRKEEGRPPLSEDEWPSTATEFTTTFLQIMQLEKLLKAIILKIFCVKVKLLGIKLLIFQILLSFCYHKRLSGYFPGNRFSLSFVILF